MSYSNYNYDHRRNRIIEPAQMLAAEDIFHPHSVQKYMLGCILDLNDGRRFRYCEEGGNGISKALMHQSAGVTSGWLEQTNTYGSGGSVGDESVYLNLSTTAAKDQFANGWMCITDATPATSLGDFYAIKGNKVGVSVSTNYAVRIYLADQGGLRGAITTSTQITVTLNQYKDTIVVPAGAATGLPIGVPLVDVTTDYFYWSQTRGPCPLIIDNDTVGPGEVVGEATTTGVNGAAGDRGAPAVEAIWGTVMRKPTNGETDQPAIVFLTLE